MNLQEQANNLIRELFLNEAAWHFDPHSKEHGRTQDPRGPWKIASLEITSAEKLGISTEEFAAQYAPSIQNDATGTVSRPIPSFENEQSLALKKAFEDVTLGLSIAQATTRVDPDPEKGVMVLRFYVREPDLNNLRKKLATPAKAPA